MVVIFNSIKPLLFVECTGRWYVQAAVNSCVQTTIVTYKPWLLLHTMQCCWHSCAYNTGDADDIVACDQLLSHMDHCCCYAHADVVAHEPTLLYTSHCQHHCYIWGDTASIVVYGMLLSHMIRYCCCVQAAVVVHEPILLHTFLDCSSHNGLHCVAQWSSPHTIQHDIWMIEECHIDINTIGAMSRDAIVAAVVVGWYSWLEVIRHCTMQLYIASVDMWLCQWRNGVTGAKEDKGDRLWQVDAGSWLLLWCDRTSCYSRDTGHHIFFLS